MDTLKRLAASGKLRLGIMGGTFDPVHYGHLSAADGALSALGLDEVLFVPTGRGPHKQGPVAPAELRYQMVVAATAPHRHFSVTRFEVDRAGVDYTVDTMADFSRRLPSGTELFFIIGTDSLPDLHTWKEPTRLMELCTLAVVHRPGHNSMQVREVLDPLGVREGAVRVDVSGLDISSTDIRQRVVRRETIRYLVPEGVHSLIEKSGCYLDVSRYSAEDDGEEG